MPSSYSLQAQLELFIIAWVDKGKIVVIVRLAIGLFAVLMLAGAGEVDARASDPARGASATADSDFSLWLAEFRKRALAAGIRAEVLDRELSGLTFNRRVIGYDRAQPDDSRPQTVPQFSDYIARRLTPSRINPGREIARNYAPTLNAVEAQYGVPTEILIGIWGMETNYGGYTGNFDLIRSLASLAFDGRREALFSGELLGALKMIDQGMVSRSRLLGSWAGATGQSQFLPTSYFKHAVDFDGDGKADIWNSRADVAASIANYLRDHGWQKGGDWAMRVSIPATFNRERVRDLIQPRTCKRVLAKHSRWIPVREWKALGFVPLDGRSWPNDDVLATFLEPDGPGKGGYLTFGNYRALLAYNCSNFYALSVGLLADAVQPTP